MDTASLRKRRGAAARADPANLAATSRADYPRNRLEVPFEARFWAAAVRYVSARDRGPG